MTSSPNNNVNEATAVGEVLYNEEYMPPFLPVLVIAFPVMPFFWKYHVRVMKNGSSNQDVEKTTTTATTRTATPLLLSFGYNTWLSSNTIELDDIDTVAPIEHINGLLQYGGWGIRMKFGSCETGYIAKNGPGIKLATTKGKLYAFNCDNPQQVCDIITQYENDGIGGGGANGGNGGNDDDDLATPLLS